jgi:hypothetical protein
VNRGMRATRLRARRHPSEKFGVSRPSPLRSSYSPEAEPPQEACGEPTSKDRAAITIVPETPRPIRSTRAVPHATEVSASAGSSPPCKMLEVGTETVNIRGAEITSETQAKPMADASTSTDHECKATVLSFGVVQQRLERTEAQRHEEHRQCMESMHRMKADFEQRFVTMTGKLDEIIQQTSGMQHKCEGGLTVQQRQRIESNRHEAQARLAATRQTSATATFCTASSLVTMPTGSAAGGPPSTWTTARQNDHNAVLAKSAPSSQDASSAPSTPAPLPPVPPRAPRPSQYPLTVSQRTRAINNQQEAQKRRDSKRPILAALPSETQEAFADLIDAEAPVTGAAGVPTSVQAGCSDNRRVEPPIFFSSDAAQKPFKAPRLDR